MTEIRRDLTPAPDFTYGSDEEAAFCAWVAETQPGPDAHQRWLEVRATYLPEYRWVREWRARVRRCRELAMKAPP